MIKIAICDDEANIRNYLTSLIQAQSRPCEIIQYASADEFLLEEQEFDLLFLDIELNSSGGDGMELARKIKARPAAGQPVIIFVTGHEQYVFDAFDVGAFQYLLKPVNEEKFAHVFARAAEEIQSRRNTSRRGRVLTLQTGSVSRTIPLDSIYYIESSNHKAVLHLQEGSFTCYAKIGNLELELKEEFFRIHKGYLVNLSYIAGYSKTEVMLTQGEKLLLSKYKYHDFVKAYLHFLQKGAGL